MEHVEEVGSEYPVQPMPSMRRSMLSLAGVLIAISCQPPTTSAFGRRFSDTHNDPPISDQQRAMFKQPVKLNKKQKAKRRK